MPIDKKWSSRYLASVSVQALMTAVTSNVSPSSYIKPVWNDHYFNLDLFKQKTTGYWIDLTVRINLLRKILHDSHTNKHVFQSKVDTSEQLKIQGKT